MENGLLDRVEGNANVHTWSEQTQLEKGDSISVGYMSELSDYTRITVTQNNLQELKEIWDQWGNETKQLFYDNYGDLPYCLDIQKLMTIIGMSEQWITARIKEKGECKCISWDVLKDLILTHPDETKKIDVFALGLYGLMVFPRALGYVDEATMDLFHRLSKRVTSVPAILAETFRSLGTCRKAGVGRFIGCAQLLLAWFYIHFQLIDRVVCWVFFEDYSSLKDIVASTKRVDVPEENWMALLQNLQSKDVEWRAPWMIPGEILYRCGSFDWGTIGYAPLLVLRQYGLRQFIPATHRLAQSEFVYKGADYKRKVSEASSAWSKTCRLKGVAISPAMTLEYVEWRGRRINDNIPKLSVEGARPIEEYLRVMPSKLEIMKQEFERKNLELEKRITKLEEEKMYLSLDVDVQKMEVEKEKKEKRKIEEDRDDLKEHYKKAQVSLRRARVGGSSDQLQKEVQEEKARVEYWEKRFQEMQSQDLALEEENKGLKTKIEQLEAREDYLREEFHQSRGQVIERDHVMGEAVAQIQEVTEYVQDLAIQADVLSLMCGSSSDIGRELALLLERVKTLGIRAKAPHRRPLVTVRPQHGPVDVGIHMNYPSGLGFNLGDNPTNPLVPDLDMVEKEDLKAEAARHLDECYRWLEENFKTLKGAGNHHGIDAKDLSLVPDLVLPHKFKMPEFEKYNGTTCPEAYITMFCRRMTGYVNNDQLLIHYFQDSLVGAAGRW
ncbi:hypothetical protein CXB51_034118 [Gossypium anomalum]|uniref:DUF7745 domain-containing protein n=1 Tax=Gossypium anomalum TaxID=47600 RepID=A0A8J5Y7M9_9ROSI|nr:hypothetical protein CXB51_034118 [Gossypium anomalum]